MTTLQKVREGCLEDKGCGLRIDYNEVKFFLPKQRESAGYLSVVVPWGEGLATSNWG